MNANGNMTERHSTKPNEPIVDDVPPLIIQSEREVFREKGGADFTVTEAIATVRHTGAQLQFHVASVRNGKTGAVCVVQKNGKDEPPAFLIARHWRVSTKQWAWEFPRGMELKAEDTLGTAIRELREETGIQVSRNQVTILQHIHADTGVLRDDIAVARILVPDSIGTPQYGDWELTNARWVAENTLRCMIASGEITDGITLAAWAIVQSHNLHQHQ